VNQYLVVVSDPKDWKLDLPGVEIVDADAYLTDATYAERPRTRVLNLCRSLRYQRTGYYVSLLAEARGHRPLPTVGTAQELKSQALIKSASDELDDVIQKALEPLTDATLELNVYFGKGGAKRYDALASALFKTFQAPLLRAYFKRRKNGEWTMHNVDALDLQELPEEHHDTLVAALVDHLSGRTPRPRKRQEARYDLAILRDPGEAEPASDARAIKRFVRAGESVGFAVEIIDREAYSRIAEFDALFIRDTTAVNHYTYRFAERAKSEGLVVMDEPSAILKCMNKVYLCELMAKNKIPTPRTMIVTRSRAKDVEATLGLPCVLKQPDSAFSAGVTKVGTRTELLQGLETLFDKSSLVIAQEFKPTEFDWRIGVLDNQPLYACRYFMAKRHWQIIKHDKQSGEKAEGRADTLPVEQAPSAVVDLAVRAASLYGDGLFGVDLKQLGKEVVVIEVNDNPTIDAGVEDDVLGDELYLRVMRYFMGRVEQKKRARRYL
jgi:glutathione synthase/RimK-type ligase-like ATP-grasp enzyme